MTLTSGSAALRIMAFEMTQMSVQMPTRVMDASGVFSLIRLTCSASSREPKVGLSTAGRLRSASRSSWICQPSVPFWQWETGSRVPSWLSI